LIDFPEHFILMLSGPLGTGKSDFCLNMANIYLREGKKVVYITTDLTPKEIYSKLQDFGLDEELENLYFFDGSIWNIKDRAKWLSEEKVKLIDISAANPNIMFEKVEAGLSVLEGNLKIFFDSLSSFLFRNDLNLAMKTFGRIVDKCRKEYGFLVFTLHEDLHPPHIFKESENLADGEIRLRFTEDEEGLKRQIKIEFLRGFSFESGWRDISLESGFLEIL